MKSVGKKRTGLFVTIGALAALGLLAAGVLAFPHLKKSARETSATSAPIVQAPSPSPVPVAVAAAAVEPVEPVEPARELSVVFTTPAPVTQVAATAPAVVVPPAKAAAAEMIIQAAGSNTIGAKLMPLLVEAFLKHMKMTDLETEEIRAEESEVRFSSRLSEGRKAFAIKAHGSSTSFKELLAGQFVTAEKLAADSIKAGQRLSDSQALMSTLELQKSAATGGGSKTRAEELFRAAITADTANPAPHLELAALLRQAGRRDEARQEFRATQALLNPVDAHTVTEATLALMELEDKADEQISTPSESPRNLAENLASAYAAMRKRNFADAANLLRTGQAMTSPDIFYYLVNDPVFRRYRDRSEVAGFWK